MTGHTSELYGTLVHLRYPTPADYPEFQKLLSDPTTMSELGYLSHQEEGGWTLEQITQRYEDRAKAQENGKWLSFAVCEKTSGRLVGDCGIKNIDLIHKHGEFGVILHHEFWGKGFAVECALLCIDYAFTHLNLHRIEFTTFTSNVRARKALEKLGIPLEGTRKEAFYSDGKFMDDRLYGILAQDWPQVREKLLHYHFPA